MKSETLNVLYSSDDNYAQHMGVSIYSLLESNRDFKAIQIFVIDNEISAENQKKLLQMTESFDNAKLILIPFEEWKNKLKLNMKWNISISSYARLFVASMLPMDVNRICYLDCDMIIFDSLLDLWQTDLQGNILGAVQDSIGNTTKAAVGMKPEEKYFNAGMLLIDLNKWREKNIETACMDFISLHNGQVVHHDQGVLNGVLKDNVFILPLKYNIMTIHYIFKLEKTMKYFGESARFYSENDIETAKDNPAILHFTPSFTSRPWIKSCAHPLKNIYWDKLRQTPWAGALPQKILQNGMCG